MKSTTFTLASLLPLVSAICDHGTRLRPRSQTAGVIEVADFGFNALDGPLNWHGLDPENADCAVGKNQSPINIYSADITTVPGSSLTFEVESYPSGAEFQNLGSTVEVETEGTLVRDGKEYELAQFHFHTPSEHRVDSEHYPMEVHFVFQAEGEFFFPVSVSLARCFFLPPTCHCPRLPDKSMFGNTRNHSLLVKSQRQEENYAPLPPLIAMIPLNYAAHSPILAFQDIPP